MRRSIISAVVATLVSAVPAQDPPAPFPPEFFAGRRAALCRLIAAQAKEGERHVVFLRGATVAAGMETFYQDQNFYYLSGVSEPDVAMLLWPSTGDEELLVPPFSPFTATWDGQRLVPGDAAAEATGFGQVGNSRSVQRRLRELADEDNLVLWTFLAPQPNKTATSSSVAKFAAAQERDHLDGRPTRGQALRSRLTDLLGDVEIRDATPLVGQLRAVKTREEIAQVRAASEIAAHGLAEAMKSARPGIYEYQIAAAARYVFTRLGAGPDAYAAIVGSGPNGCVLHYNTNTRQARDGDLVVMDYGPTVHGYCTDVTRTFPVNGKFTPEQRELVTDVYEIQQELISNVRPGARLSALGAMCARLLKARGYRSDHGPCHHVGLAVHDKQGDVLEPGMLITVEPGAYLRDEGMGCRIEDVVLVTEDGCEVLSAGVPAKPDEIEALMQQPGLQQVPVGLSER